MGCSTGRTQPCSKSCSNSCKTALFLTQTKERRTPGPRSRGSVLEKKSCAFRAGDCSSHTATGIPCRGTTHPFTLAQHLQRVGYTLVLVKRHCFAPVMHQSRTLYVAEQMKRANPSQYKWCASYIHAAFQLWHVSCVILVVVFESIHRLG